MTERDDPPPDSAGVLFMSVGVFAVATAALLITIVAVILPDRLVGVPSDWVGWFDLAVNVLGGIGIAGSGLVSLIAGIVSFGFGCANFNAWRAAPNRRSVSSHFKEFMEDIRASDEDYSSPTVVPRVDPAAGGGQTRDDRIDVERLPNDVAAAVRPFLRPGTRYVSPKQLTELLDEAARLLRARERFAAQEKATVDRQTDLDLARARASYVAGLSEEERAIFASAVAGNGSDAA